MINVFYIKVCVNKLIFFVLYVGDILLASSDTSLFKKYFLLENFEMKDLEEASFILLIEIHRDRSRGIRFIAKGLYGSHV